VATSKRQKDKLLTFADKVYLEEGRFCSWNYVDSKWFPFQTCAKFELSCVIVIHDMSSDDQFSCDIIAKLVEHSSNVRHLYKVKF